MDSFNEMRNDCPQLEITIQREIQEYELPDRNSRSFNRSTSGKADCTCIDERVVTSQENDSRYPTEDKSINHCNAGNRHSGVPGSPRTEFYIVNEKKEYAEKVPRTANLTYSTHVRENRSFNAGCLPAKDMPVIFPSAYSCKDEHLHISVRYVGRQPVRFQVASESNPHRRNSSDAITICMSQDRSTSNSEFRQARTHNGNADAFRTEEAAPKNNCCRHQGVNTDVSSMSGSVGVKRICRDKLLPKKPPEHEQDCGNCYPITRPPSCNRLRDDDSVAIQIEDDCAIEKLPPTVPADTDEYYKRNGADSVANDVSNDIDPWFDMV